VSGWRANTNAHVLLVGYIYWNSEPGPGVTISDAAGNQYETIADLQTSPQCDFGSPGCNTMGTHIRAFMCPNFSSPSGTFTITTTASYPYTFSAVVAAVALQPGYPPPPSLVDPVTDDPATSLMNGPSVTSDLSQLAVGGVPVSGVSTAEPNHC